MIHEAIVTEDGSTEHFYFNLTEAELTKLQMRTPGGMAKYLQEVIDSNDGGKIIETFEMLLKASYGRKDGIRFMKKAEWFEEISATQAYSDLFMKLVTDAEFGAKFFNGIMPADLMKRAEAAAAKERNLKGLAPSLAVVDEAHIFADHTPVPTPLSAEDPSPAEELSEEELLVRLGVVDMSPKDYSKMSAAELRKLPRKELIAAYKQKSLGN